MRFWFHSAAEADLAATVEYYEACEPGLREDFFLEVQASLANVLAYPLAWPAKEVNIRQCLLHRFPYGVLYGVEPDGIEILAIMHLHRRPGSWRDRLDLA
jgi:hypothetical protein